MCIIYTPNVIQTEFIILIIILIISLENGIYALPSVMRLDQHFGQITLIICLFLYMTCVELYFNLITSYSTYHAFAVAGPWLGQGTSSVLQVASPYLRVRGHRG